MAGDVGIEERAIVLAVNASMTAAEAANLMRQAGGKVQQFYGPRVIIGEVTPEAEESLRAAVTEGELVASPEALSAGVQSDLDDVGALGLEAFFLRQSDQYAEAKAKRHLDGEPWDTAAASAPCLFPLHEEDAGAESAFRHGVYRPTSERLTGSVAMAIVIVSGPGDLAFTDDERRKVIAEVQNALTWLGGQSYGGNVQWSWKIEAVTISIPENKDLPPGELEALWRNPAMEKLGLQGTWQGVVKYVEALQDNPGIQWAFCAYFTKYPVQHFAYASIGGPRLVMTYKIDGWGPGNIDRVFAHETGHIFGAPDEYKASGCNCEGAWGVYKRPNGNCANCAPGGSVSCIMRKNSWDVCHYTTWHLGFRWPDGDVTNEVNSTPTSVAAVAQNDTLFAFWKANDPSNLIYSSYYAGDFPEPWAPGYRINGVNKSPEAPAAAVFDGKLYVFWKANDPSNLIYYSAGAGRSIFPNGTKINEANTSPKSPAAAVFDGKLYVFWKANDRSNVIYYSASSDGLQWPIGQALDPAKANNTPEAPAATVFNDKLYVFWRTNNESIHFSASADGVVWPAGTQINDVDRTPLGPAASFFNGNLYLFWNRADKIYFSASSDGLEWPKGQVINELSRSFFAPSVAIFKDSPYLFWNSTRHSNSILFSP